MHHSSHNHTQTHTNDHLKQKTVVSCSKTLRLSTMICMTFSIFIVEFIIGEYTNSITLKADSFHMLADVIALCIGLFAVRLSKRQTKKNTYGWVRAEIVGALVNAVFLMSLCLSNSIEAIKRIIESKSLEQIDVLLYVALGGLLVNIIGLFIFGHGHSHSSSHNHSHTSDIEKNGFLENGDVCVHEHEHEHEEKSKFCNIFSSHINMNIRAVFLHVLADALGSVAVIISALVYKFHEKLGLSEDFIKYIDPILCLCFMILIFVTTIPLIFESIHILMQSVPKEIQMNSLREELINTKGIKSIKELHVWRLTTETIIGTAHLEFLSMQNYMNIATHINSLFTKHGIKSTTIQPLFLTTKMDATSTNSLQIEDKKI